MLLLALLPTGAARALSDGEARHLLVRTGFGATQPEIDRLLPLDRAQAVDLLLEEAALPSSFPLPDWADLNPMTIRGLEDRAVADALLAEQAAALKAWWIGRMLASPTPLRERMTLFWHGHFATALSKVRSPQLMLRQNGLLRRHALGDYSALLAAMVADPAMLLYLDGGSSTAAAPNENLAREVMELFALGVGTYSEAEIREAARALTGWVVHPATGDAVFVPARHDGGTKTLFGQTGPWDGEDVVRILLEQPEAARFVAGRLWAGFVSQPPGEDELAMLAGGFRDDGYRIAPLLRAILLSEAFWRIEERGAMIAAPVEWAVGALRLLDAHDTPPGPVAELAADLGQDLFEPPDVAGWPGGERWIATATLGRRLAALHRFIGGRRDAAAELGLAARRSAALVRWLDGLPFAWRRPDRLQALVLPLPPVASGGSQLPVADSPDPEVLADLVRGWLTDPVFQLK
ncbi:MAG: DUF1800 family protein [Alphaproteobacteria bacterium]